MWAIELMEISIEWLIRTILYLFVGVLRIVTNIKGHKTDLIMLITMVSILIIKIHIFRYNKISFIDIVLLILPIIYLRRIGKEHYHKKDG
jgi:hypothetical protein